MTSLRQSRPAAVAGVFYPGDAGELAGTIRSLLTGTAANPEALSPKALIVPHAGYVYSGPIAATAYALLAPLRSMIRRVVLLGPAHRVAVRGLSLPGVEAFSTPLGLIPLDLDVIEQLHALPQITTRSAAHAEEHSLEVQLPFLQLALDSFQLVPLVVGDATAEEVAEVLETLWGGPETLIVISSDLSHYHPYESAQRLDGDTCRHIVNLQFLTSHEQACGATPINGLVLAARRHGLAPRLLDLRNSGDTAGDRARVVGYAAFAFTGAPGHEH